MKCWHDVTCNENATVRFLGPRTNLVMYFCDAHAENRVRDCERLGLTYVIERLEP